ncbi:Holo-[acyl-carrier-protein] synthase [Betaproteobacteria bacterium MOLA814]|jgi:holo-[acyl-carrier protein] synthase|nr:Holo-[acyl-carrier-protein] synthase [Betaproteobacteria bacterium MOLA814]
MIVGVGVDICEVSRIEQALVRHGERFARKVLGPQEQLVWQARTARLSDRGMRFVATRFSAKEAFSKAIGLGMRMPMTWRNCEILNSASGQPYIVLSGELAAWFAAKNWRAHVSLSDESAYATSHVVVETI